MFSKTKIIQFANERAEAMPDGYRETIQSGMAALRHFRGYVSYGTGATGERIKKLGEEIASADALVIGAGAGLSTSAGFVYSGKRFEKWFGDFALKYGFEDMYSGGFYPYRSREEFWAYWARYIYVNRYLDAPKPVYNELHELIKDKDYFVITTNVDHCFQKAGFEKGRLFYTQGDYGLFQSTDPSVRKTYDNEAWVMRAMEAQGFVKNDEGIFEIPAGRKALMCIPPELIPVCPDGGAEMTMNLRSDDSFVEDEGWKKASAAYARFLRGHKDGHVLFLELGVGRNTPVIIKYPFWQMTFDNENAVYACVNYGEAHCPREIESRSICIDNDIGAVLDGLKSKKVG